ncbi:metallophosphoesterase [Paenibacillus sp. MBLB4367]|uniref:metallophosphoesterase n=1 Tax=Paenibacillus sp. MBLB4367 TaxID=3384767 RepID=UPI003907FF0B
MDPTTVRMNRRSFLKKGAMILAGTIAAPSAAFAYSRYLEPSWLEVKQVALTLPRLPAAFDGLRIVQFSDVHLGYHFDPVKLDNLVTRINALAPDLVCFTGDLFDFAVGGDGPRTIQALSRIEAKLGKWAVLGNHDYYAGFRNVQKLLIQGGFHVMMNESAPVEKDGSKLWMAGVTDMNEGKPDLDSALLKAKTKPGKEDFVLLLSHAPDFADKALGYSVDLQLSGHSHGGQVRLPFFGAVRTPPNGHKYVAGHYILGDGKLQVYTNRGIGVTIYPARFLCRPELTVMTLARKHQ